MVGRRWMAGGIAVVAALLACSSPERTDGEAKERPSELARLLTRLEERNLKPERVQRLRDSRELPECPEAEWRYRLHFGADDFVNVSRFARSEDAEACRGAFLEMAAKAGRSAIEKMGEDAQVRDAWLYVFPTTAEGQARRQQFFPQPHQAER